MKHLCYLTYEDNPEDPDPDFDKPILISALDEIGYRVSPQNWRKAKDLEQFDAVLIRSPWDYSQHLSEFLQWFQYWESLVKFINPPKIVLENIDKRYLFKLAEFGIPIIPSQLIDNKVPSLQNVDYEQKLVLKPVIGAGARGAFTTEPVLKSILRLARFLFCCNHICPKLIFKARLPLCVVMEYRYMP